MAGAGWRTFTAGAVLTAAQVQNYLQDQSVQVYASAAARSSALGTAVSTGMVSYRTDGTVVEFYNGSAWVALGTGLGDVTQTGVQTLTNKTLTGAVIGGATRELAYTTATGFAGYSYYVTTNGELQIITANSTANGTLNITSTSGANLTTIMNVGDTVTVTLVIQNGATAYYPTAIAIDSTGLTQGTNLFWQGGTAPTAGNANARDVYTFSITKLSATPTWFVLGSVTKFA